MLVLKNKIKKLRIEDVAWLLDTDVKTVQRWANAGIIRPCRTAPRGDILFRLDDIARLLVRLGV